MFGPCFVMQYLVLSCFAIVSLLLYFECVFAVMWLLVFCDSCRGAVV